MSGRAFWDISGQDRVTANFMRKLYRKTHNGNCPGQNRSQNRSRSRSREAGVTLIALAIFILLIGIITTAALQIQKISQVQKRYETANGRLKELSAIIDAYIERNGRLPCPASLTAGPDLTVTRGAITYSYGEEISNDCSTAPVPPAGDAAALGVFRVAGSFGTNVRIGAVPTRTLAMQDKMMLDGFDHRIVYAVVEELTSPPAGPPPWTRFQTAYGGITVKTPVAMGGPLVNATAQSGNVYYVLISPGDDQRGAYSPDGVLKAPCEVNTLAGNNCDFTDSIFVENVYKSTVNTAARYTSTVSYKAAPKLNNMWREDWGACNCASGQESAVVNCVDGMSDAIIGGGVGDPVSQAACGAPTIPVPPVPGPRACTSFATCPVGGRCDPLDTVASAVAPSGDVCLAPVEPLAVLVLNPPVTSNDATGFPPWVYEWTCPGINGGNSAVCRADRIVAGACGPAHGSTLPGPPPDANRCGIGTETANSFRPAGGGAWQWTCDGINGGAISGLCASNQRIDGACGPANGVLTVAPPAAADLCTDAAMMGWPGSVALAGGPTTGAWTWTCGGTNGGTPSPSCSTAQLISGVCGPAESDSRNPAVSGLTLCDKHFGPGPVVTDTSGFGNGPWTWTCLGNNGMNDTCSTFVTAPSLDADGKCGPTHGTVLAVPPLMGDCSVYAGAPPAVTDMSGIGGGPWVWWCGGSGTGFDTPCMATMNPAPPPAVDGKCGAANFAVLVSPPSGAALCSVGSASNVSGGVTGPWQWTCGPTRTAGCMAMPVPVVDGQCGTANGVASGVAPAANLCPPGLTASPVSGGAGSAWTWTCDLGAGAAAAKCFAPFLGGAPACGDPSYTVLDGAYLTARPSRAIPTANLCKNGPLLSGPFSPRLDFWTWRCGTAASSVECRVPYGSPGLCGTADGVPSVAKPPVANLCVAGVTASDVTGGAGTLWTWTCDTASCSAPFSGTAAQCGSAAGVPSSSKPLHNLCKVSNGTLASVFSLMDPTWRVFTSDVAEWFWRCPGSSPATGPICRAPIPRVQPMCGPADGVVLAAGDPAPAAKDLCAAGFVLEFPPSKTSMASSGVGGAEKWQWRCRGTAVQAPTNFSDSYGIDCSALVAAEVYCPQIVINDVTDRNGSSEIFPAVQFGRTILGGTKTQSEGCGRQVTGRCVGPVVPHWEIQVTGTNPACHPEQTCPAQPRADPCNGSGGNVLTWDGDIPIGIKKGLPQAGAGQEFELTTTIGTVRERWKCGYTTPVESNPVIPGVQMTLFVPQWVRTSVSGDCPLPLPPAPSPGLCGPAHQQLMSASPTSDTLCTNAPGGISGPYPSQFSSWWTNVWKCIGTESGVDTSAQCYTMNVFPPRPPPLPVVGIAPALSGVSPPLSPRGGGDTVVRNTFVCADFINPNSPMVITRYCAVVPIVDANNPAKIGLKLVQDGTLDAFGRPNYKLGYEVGMPYPKGGQYWHATHVPPWGCGGGGPLTQYCP